MKKVCVFASGGVTQNEIYNKSAFDLGAELAKNGLSMVFGAGGTGLMGQCARGLKSSGGYLVGVIPEFLIAPGICFDDIDKTIVTKTMHERKQTMENMSDAFVALPGGFGTFEELLEVITLKLLCEHAKPVVILNSDGYYNKLKEAFMFIFSEKFADISFIDTFFFAPSVDLAISYILNYEEKPLIKKHIKCLSDNLV